MPGRTVRLTGWGRVSPSSAEVASPGSAAAAAEVLARGTAALSGVVVAAAQAAGNHAAARGGAGQHLGGGRGGARGSQFGGRRRDPAPAGEPDGTAWHGHGSYPAAGTTIRSVYSEIFYSERAVVRPALSRSAARREERHADR